MNKSASEFVISRNWGAPKYATFDIVSRDAQNVNWVSRISFEVGIYWCLMLYIDGLKEATTHRRTRMGTRLKTLSLNILQTVSGSEIRFFFDHLCTRRFSGGLFLNLYFELACFCSSETISFCSSISKNVATRVDCGCERDWRVCQSYRQVLWCFPRSLH